MFTILKTELQPLTHDLAVQFADMKRVPGERLLKGIRLKYFEDLIKAGTFADPTWSVGICKEDSETYRLDGQHTSTQLAATPTELFPVGRHVQVTTYEFDSVGIDGAALFNKFDNPHSTRTNQDMMTFYRSEWDDIENINPELCMKIANGIYQWELGNKSKDKYLYSPRIRGSYYRAAEFRMFANWVNDIAQCDNIRLDFVLGKPGVMAEMLADWKISPEVAESFWLYVLRENHPDVDHITRQLGEDFKKWRSKPERHSQSQYRTRAMRAWGRYHKEQDLDEVLLPLADKSKPTEQQPSA